MTINNVNSAIDVGTNTIRLLIGKVENGHLVRLASDRAVTRLGKNLMKSGRLNPASVKASLKALKRFKNKCAEYGVGKILAVGTSALREAADGRKFRSQVKKNTGIDIRIISGKKEAELTLAGIQAAGTLPVPHLRPKPQMSPPVNRDSSPSSGLFVIDIGGGSTEWILQRTEVRRRNSSLILGSIPVGAVKLFETFIKHDPPLPSELREVGTFLRSAIRNALKSSVLTGDHPLSFIATGGTPTTLAAIRLRMKKYDGDRVHMHSIALSSLKSLLRNLARMPLSEREETAGMESQRADIIITGTMILAAFMEHLNLKRVTVSDYGLLEGLLLCHSPLSFGRDRALIP